jgi:cation transport regulator
MPYASNADLPPSVRHALPEHAQDIYRAAFNNAWEQHVTSRGVDEATVHRIAWGAVKRHYRKLGGKWVPRP